jgi:hypothetical protein
VHAAAAVAETYPFADGVARMTQLATIELARGPAPALDDTWLRAVLERRMVRAEFDDGVKLPSELREAILAIAKRHDGLVLHLLTDSPTLFFLGKFQELADTTVFNRDAFALELGEWLIPNDSNAALGMRGREFGLDDAVTRHFHRGLLRQEPLLPDEIAGLAKAGNLGIRSASAVGVITVAEDGVPQRLAAGRAFEEIALALGRAGFVTSMHAGITEVDSAGLALRGRLRTHARPTVVFRIGVPLRPEEGRRPHSSRPTLMDVVVE